MFSLPAGNLTTVSRWNTGNPGSYLSWQSAIPGVNNFLLVPGQAYWILIKASGTLSYNP
jgi:hypothetical protein